MPDKTHFPPPPLISCTCTEPPLAAFKIYSGFSLSSIQLLMALAVPSSPSLIAFPYHCYFYSVEWRLTQGFLLALSVSSAFIFLMGEGFSPNNQQAPAFSNTWRFVWEGVYAMQGFLGHPSPREHSDRGSGFPAVMWMSLPMVAQ